jgi:hypothetical protein
MYVMALSSVVIYRFKDACPPLVDGDLRILVRLWWMVI